MARSSIPPYLADRVLNVAPSASGAAAQRARELLASGRSIMNLTAGEPDFDTPASICEAAFRAIEQGETRYTTVDGTPALKKAVAEKFSRENGLDYGVGEVMVSSGAKQVIFNAIMATINEGDEAIIPVPSWVSYPEMVRFAGGIPILVACEQTQRFKITPAQLEAAITPRTKWLMLNSPGNPTGAVYSQQELAALGEVLLRHPHVLTLCDDIYEHLLYDGLKYYTLAQAVPALRERVLTVNGVSKAYAMTGWRIGYAAGPAELLKQMRKIQSQSTSNPCSISQAGALAALTGPQDFIAANAAEFQARRDLVVEALNATPGISCDTPQGAFYVYVSCAACIGKKTPEGKVIEDDGDFVAYLLEQGVAAVAGKAYGLSPYFRLSFATSRENLAEACRRIHDATRKLS